MAIKVLIYEDNLPLRESLSELVEKISSYKLAGALENCNSVKQDIELFEPDVVLMDIGMPGISGIEGVKIIRKYFPHIEVLMLTVFEDDENVFNAICAGASGYLLKKSSNEKILEAIEDVYNGGAPITSSIAKKILRLFPKKPSPNQAINKLTVREQQVLQLFANGNSYKMVAAELSISIDSVRTYVRRMYEKLQVHSVTEAIHKAFP
ncbi:MAG TPA: response regulator transcription factor [Parafilimonas sp.]|nr:response regulator transcription factor [Parafilimonas sp.]